MQIQRGQTALVTGAASGIGRCIALELAQQGVNLRLLDIDEPQLIRLAAEIRNFGVSVTTHTCDLTSAGDISAITSELLALQVPLNILINNAGIVYYGPMDLMSADQWDRLLSVNLLAPIQLTRELLPLLLGSTPNAHILNVCSIAGLVAGGGRSTAYETSKFGLVGFTEAIRGEYGRQGLGVTALCPGPVHTELFRNGIAGKKSRPVPVPPGWLSTSPERVARRAVRSIQRNQRQVLITPMAHALFNVKRFAPWLLDAASQFQRKKKRKRPAPDQSTTGHTNLPTSTRDAA